MFFNPLTCLLAVFALVSTFISGSTPWQKGNLWQKIWEQVFPILAWLTLILLCIKDGEIIPFICTFTLAIIILIVNKIIGL